MARRAGGCAMVGKSALRMFLLPGNLVCDAIGARADDDRAMIRSLVNMLFWNSAVVLTVVLW
jgi:hypothetical protein